MLKMMRHHARYFYVLFFIVILSFIFWGVGTVDKADKSSIVAEVEQYKITGEEYWRAYDRTVDFYRDLYKERFDEETQKKLKLKENILNTLIDNRVLLLAATKNGITVSDEELNDAIRHEPSFMKDGSFDSDVYLNRLRLSRITPETYESSKRQELLVKKARRMIELAVIPPGDQLSQLSGNEQTIKAVQDALMNSARDKAVKAYVEGMKKGLKIKVYQDLIS